MSEARCPDLLAAVTEDVIRAISRDSADPPAPRLQVWRLKVEIEATAVLG